MYEDMTVCSAGQPGIHFTDTPVIIEDQVREAAKKSSFFFNGRAMKRRGVKGRPLSKKELFKAFLFANKRSDSH